MITVEYLIAIMTLINITLFIVFIGVVIWAINDSNKWD